MDIPFFQVDAFTSKIFGGNPAAVMLLDTNLKDSVMQNIAAENNLSETAFALREETRDNVLRYRLRWFTPSQEVDLCGHATLATAHVLFDTNKVDQVIFETLSGPLLAKRIDDKIELDFPSRPPIRLDEIPKGLTSIEPISAYGSRDLVLQYRNEKEIRELVPDHEEIRRLNYLGLIVTAPGIASDFVSRFFAPKVSVPEDPVTGSAHATLAPFWESRLKKSKLTGIQLSSRRGEVFCEMSGDRVKISGQCRSVIKGTFIL